MQLERSYKGNMGFEEMMKFYDVASNSDIKKLETLIDKNKTEEAWDLLQQVTGINLK